jgi:hypothetical protein
MSEYRQTVLAEINSQKALTLCLSFPTYFGEGNHYESIPFQDENGEAAHWGDSLDFEVNEHIASVEAGIDYFNKEKAVAIIFTWPSWHEKELGKYLSNLYYENPQLRHLYIYASDISLELINILELKQLGYSIPNIKDIGDFSSLQLSTS